MTTDIASIIADLYRRAAALEPPVPQAGGIRADSALRRYREGMTTLDQLHTELTLLGYGPTQINRLTEVARLDYDFDLTSDRIAAYSDAYVKGQIDDDDLVEYLRDLGLVRERIDAYLLSARIKRVGKVKPVVSIPHYKTEAGKLRLSALKDAVRSGLITIAAFRAALPELEIPTDLADALADYEEFRRPVVAIPYYKTEAGKIHLAALKYSIRSGLITIAAFRAALPELEIPTDLADALADYEELRAAPE